MEEPSLRTVTDGDARETMCLWMMAVGFEWEEEKKKEEQGILKRESEKIQMDGHFLFPN